MTTPTLPNVRCWLAAALCALWCSSLAFASALTMVSGGRLPAASPLAGAGMVGHTAVCHCLHCVGGAGMSGKCCCCRAGRTPAEGLAFRPACDRSDDGVPLPAAAKGALVCPPSRSLFSPAFAFSATASAPLQADAAASGRAPAPFSPPPRLS